MRQNDFSYFRFKVLKFKLKVKRSQKWSANVRCFLFWTLFSSRMCWGFSLDPTSSAWFVHLHWNVASGWSYVSGKCCWHRYSRARRWDFRLWVAPSSPDHSKKKNVCRRNPVSRSGVVMWGFVVGFWHIYSVDGGTGEIFVGWFTLNWKCVINVSGHRCSFIYSSALKASALFWNIFCHLVFWRRGRRTAV